MPHVMVVEDDDDIRRCLRELLEDEGYSVTTAANGAQALDLLGRSERPCVMLVDLLMPVMDGVEMIEHLRRDADLARIPVVALSAASAAQPPAGTPLLRKPVGYQAILDAVEHACGAMPRVPATQG